MSDEMSGAKSGAKSRRKSGARSGAMPGADSGEMPGPPEDAMSSGQMPGAGMAETPAAPGMPGENVPHEAMSEAPSAAATMAGSPRQIVPTAEFVARGVAGDAAAAGPRQIVPMADFEARGLAPVVGAAPSLQNHGGPVLGSVQVVPIYWGAAWATGTNAQLTTQLDGFFDFIVTSSYMDLLQEYSTASTQIQHGQRLASARISNSEPGTVVGGVRQVTDAQVQTAVQGWIASNTVPATTANTLYFVFLPPNVISLMGAQQSCQNYCGYHNHIGNVYYAVIPFANCAGCVFPGQFLDTLTEVSSHEFAEAVTDPALNAWWDPGTGDEIGDICNRQTTHLGGYLVQTEWSNAQNACVIAPVAVAATPRQSSKPVVAWGANRLDVFVLGTDRALYHKWFDGSAWGPSPTGYESLGGVCMSSPRAVSWGPNRLDIFVIGTDGALYHKWFDGSAWGPSPTGYESLGGVCVSEPEVVAWGPNRLDVFVLGTDSALYHKWFDGSAWGPSLTGYEGQGGICTSRPRVTSWGPNRLDIFVTGTDSALYHKWFDGSAWGPSLTGYEGQGGVISPF